MNTAVFIFPSDIYIELRNIQKILKELRRKGVPNNQPDPQTGYEANTLKSYRSELLKELSNREKYRQTDRETRQR